MNEPTLPSNLNKPQKPNPFATPSKPQTPKVHPKDLPGAIGWEGWGEDIEKIETSENLAEQPKSEPITIDIPRENQQGLFNLGDIGRLEASVAPVESFKATEEIKIEEVKVEAKKEESSLEFGGSVTFSSETITESKETKPTTTNTLPKVDLSQGVSELSQVTIKATEEVVKTVGTNVIETANAGSELLNMIIKGPGEVKKADPKKEAEKKAMQAQIYQQNRSIVMQSIAEYKAQVDIAIGKDQARILEDIGGSGMSITEVNAIQGKNKNYLHKLSIYEIADVRRMLIERKQLEERKKNEQSIAASSRKGANTDLNKIAEGGSMLSTTGGNAG